MTRINHSMQLYSRSNSEQTGFGTLWNNWPFEVFYSTSHMNKKRKETEKKKLIAVLLTLCMLLSLALAEGTTEYSWTNYEDTYQIAILEMAEGDVSLLNPVRAGNLEPVWRQRRGEPGSLDHPADQAENR